MENKANEEDIQRGDRMCWVSSYVCYDVQS
jgi:hypothetical protein